LEEFRVRFFGRKQPEIFKIRYIQKVLDTPDFQRYIPIPLKKQWEKERKRDGNRESEKPGISSQHNIAKGTNPSKNPRSTKYSNFTRSEFRDVAG
jgi:hypothetical protein